MLFSKLRRHKTVFSRITLRSQQPITIEKLQHHICRFENRTFLGFENETLRTCARKTHIIDP